MSDNISGTFFEKAAILIPVAFKESTQINYLQLDTGSPSSYIYSKVYEKIIPSTRALKAERPILKFLISGEEFTHCFKQDTATGFTQEEAGYISIGLLGNDFFSNKAVQIDFINQVIITFDSTPPGMNIDFFNAEFHNGRILLRLSFNNRTLNVIYDTGASIFPLVVIDKMIWSKLTHRDVISSDNGRLMVSAAFNRRLSFVCNSIKENLFLKNINLRGLPVYIDTDETHNSDFSKINCDGVIGNALFYDNSKIFIDFKQGKMGISKS